MTTHSRLRNLLRGLAASVLLWLAACGGGVETGGTGATGAFIEGPIAGFGSIIVNGVRFDERNATVTDADGGAFNRDNLRLGMVVEVQSDRPMDDGNGGRSATARHVRLGGSLTGPLEGTTQMGGITFIRVLGQVVRLTKATVFEGVTGGAAGLSVSDVLEVHGFPSPDSAVSDIVATRVEKRGIASAQFRVRGIARDVARLGSPPTLRVGSAVFDLTDTGVPADLADGTVVRLAVGNAQVDGRWPVERITVESRRLEDGAEAEVEGLVTSLLNQRSFAVNGVAVDARSATMPATALALGTRVEVKGRESNGVLVAATVELRTDDQVFNDGIDLKGLLSGLDKNAKTFVLRGVTIVYGPSPPLQYVQGTEDDLQNDACVRVRAKLDADGTRALATRIEFRSICSP